MGNYNGVMEIISALHLGAIQSLKKTWKEVPEKDIELFKELSALMNLTDNYRVRLYYGLLISAAPCNDNPC